MGEHEHRWLDPLRAEAHKQLIKLSLLDRILAYNLVNSHLFRSNKGFTSLYLTFLIEARIIFPLGLL